MNGILENFASWRLLWNGLIPPLFRLHHSAPHHSANLFSGMNFGQNDEGSDESNQTRSLTLPAI